MPAAASNLQRLSQLRRQWRRAWIGALPFLAGALWLWHALGGAGAAVQGGLQTTAVMVYLWLRTGRMLALNRPPGDLRLRPTLGAPTTLTLLRAALIAVLGGFLFQPALDPGRPASWAAWLPAILYLVAVAVDAIDGALARATGGETLLGQRLDVEVDALGLLTAASLAVWLGRAPAAYLAVGFGYYLVQAAIGLRDRRGRPVARIHPRGEARIAAGCAMGFSVAILMPLFAAPALVPAAAAIATALTAGFLLDWLIACGWAAPDGRLFNTPAALLQRLIERAWPLALRAGVAAGAGLLLMSPADSGGVPELSSIERTVLAGGAVMTALGLAARLASVALSLVAAGVPAAGAPDAGWILVAACAAFLIMAGAGRPRLWQPEERGLKTPLVDRERPQGSK
jgi:CDP-diacylglycerol--glycerol-3-phosphate 3-phosphatidyltransferase